MKKLLLLVSIVFVSAIGYNQYFVEDFENGGVFPTSWGLSNGTDDWDIDQGNDFGPGSAQSGTYSAFFNDYDYLSGVTADMISPSIDLTSASAPELKFWYHDGNGSDVVEVLVSTDSLTFTSVYTTQGTVSPWTEIVVDLTAYAGNATVHIAFRGLSVYGSTNPHVDNIVVAEAPTCPVPSLFASFGETSTTTNLGWLAGGSETEWLVEYGAPGYAFGTGTAVSALDDTLNVTGLTASTTYDFYLRAVCAVGDTSGVVGPISLTTGCNTFTTFPYTQNFDGMTASSPGFGCYTTDDIDDCWSNDAANPNMWAVLSGATGSGSTGPSSDNTSGTGQYIYLESSSCANTSIVYSPVFDLASLTLPQLEFAYHMYGTNTGSLTVEITTDGGTTWSPIWTLAGDQGNSWFTSEVVLSAYVGATAQLRFVGVSGTTSSDIALDDISIVEAPSCPAPSALDAYNISFDTAMFGFIAGANDSSYIIEYGVAGFALGAGTFINGVEDTVSVNGLMESTTYEYYVRSICTIGDTSELVGPFSFTTLNSCPVASAFVDDFIGEDSTLLRWTAGPSDSSYIIEYGVTGFTPGSGMFVSGTGDSAAINGLMGATEYEFYLRTICTAGDTSLVVGPITATTTCPALFNPPYTQDFSTYVPDCWTEATGRLSASTVVSGTFSSWTSDGFGNVGTTGSGRINIYGTGVDEWLISPTFDLGTGAINYQVEFDIALTDYNNSNVPDNGNFGDDDSLAVVVSTDNGATWSTANIALLLDTGNVPSNTGTHYVVDLSTYTGLVKIGFYAASSASNEDNDLFVDNVWLRETPSCPELDSIVAYNVESMQVDVTWKQGAADNSWVIEFDTANFALGTGNTIVASNDTTTILGLLPLTSYDVYVRNVCAVGDSGLWQGPVTFTTPADCPDPNSISDFLLARDSNNLTWIGGVADSSYFIEWDTAGFTLGSATSNKSTSLEDTVALTGLMSNTSYDFYVRTLCKTLDTSNWVGPFNFTTVESCPVLTAITSFDIARDSLNLTWTAGQYDSVWLIEYDTTGFTPGSATSTKVTATNDTVGITSLMPDTDYDFYVRAICTAGDTSVLVGPFNETTTVSCPGPDSISAFGATLDSLNITWVPGAYDSVWEVQYDTTGFTLGAGTTVSTTTDSLGVAGFVLNSTYDFYVRSICSVGDTSAWVGPFTTSTLCNIFTPPYAQDFFTYLPDCWEEAEGELRAISNLSFGTSGFAQKDFINQGFDSAAAVNMYDFGGTQNDWIISPTIDLGNGATPYILEFDIALTAWNSSAASALDTEDTVNVVISTDNGATWSNANTLVTFDANNQISSTGDHIIFDLSTLPYTGLVKFGIHATSTGTANDDDLFIDNFEVNVKPNCLQAVSLSSISIGSDSAILTWTGSATDSAYILEYDTAGFTPGNGTSTVLNVTNDTVIINGLTANTAYDFYVRTLCVGNDTSAASGPGSFSTECVVILTLPYTETFDDSSSTESCWTVLDNNNDGDAWDLDYTTNPFAGDEVAVINTDFNSGANDDYLISPAVLLNGNQRIRFQTRAQSAGEPNDYEIVVSSTGKNAIDFATVIGSETISSTTYEEKIYNLTGLTGNYFIAVKIPAGGLDGWRLYVDDFTIEDIPSCPKPLNLRAYNTGSDSTLVTWDGSANDSVFNVEYGVIGFTPGTGTVISALNDTLAITGLMSNTEYEFYVRSICSVGDSAVVVAPGTFRTECAIFTSLPFLETFDDTSSTEACWTVLNNNADGDEWNLNYATNPFAGNQVANINTDFNSGANDDYLISPKFTLNGNQRIVFQTRAQSAGEPNDYEVVVSSTGKSAADFVTIIGADTISSTTYEEKIYNMAGLIGDYYIAVKIPAGGLDGWRLYIDNFVVEDIPSCPKPSLFALNNPGTDSINFTWSQAINDSSWVIEYGPVGFTPGTGTSSFYANDTVTLNGLTPDTPYDFYLRSICTAGDTSVYVGPLTDSTLPTCPVPTNLVVNNPTTSTLDVTWTAGINDVSWMLEYGPKGFTQGTGTVIPAASTFQQLTMLAADVEYDVYVRGICGAGDSSRWVGPSSDTTLPTCLRVQSFTQLTADSVSINVGWNLDPSQTGFVLEFGPKGFTLGSGTSVTLGALDNFYQATGLNPLTEYDFYIRAYCANGDSSIFDGPFTFITDCPSSLGVPYTQDFSNYVPECWDEATGRLSTGTVLTTANSNWGEDGFANNGTTGAARINIFGTTRDEWLITPTFDLGSDAAKAYLVEFDVALTDFANSNAPDNGNFGDDDTLALVISRDNGATWNTSDILVLMDTGNIPSVTGNRVSYILTNTTGLVKFGFYAASSVSNEDNDAHIDNFSIQDTAAPVGVAEETAVLSQFKVYPNPNNGNFTLLNEGNSLNTSVTVMDVQGRTVYTNTMFFGQGARKGVSLENTESGIYFLVIENNGRRELHRVVIE